MRVLRDLTAPEITDRALEELIPSATTVPRPSIVLCATPSLPAASDCVRGWPEAAVTIAGSFPSGIAHLGAAIEMLHTYRSFTTICPLSTTTTCAAASPPATWFLARPSPSSLETRCKLALLKCSLASSHRPLQPCRLLPSSPTQSALSKA